MKKAVLFDMDGLMIDSERLTWEGYKKECGKRGYEMTYAFYKTMLGHPMSVLRKMLADYFGDEFPLEEVIKAVHTYMEEIFVSQGVPKKPGLMDILEYTKKKGYKTLVATSSDRERVERILKYAEIEEYFDDIICGNEVERGKPNPDIFELGCKKLEVTPEEAYVIEDSEMGIQAAYNAGIDVICVPDMKDPEEKYKKMVLCVAKDLTAVKEVIAKRDEEEMARLKEITDIPAFGFHHVCVIATNYQKAIRFYVDCLGLRVYRSSYSERRKAKKLELYNGEEYVIELFIKEEGGDIAVECEDIKSCAGLEHLAFQTDDVEGTLEYLTARGVPVSAVKSDQITGKKYGFCWDPDGTKIEFYER